MEEYINEQHIDEQQTDQTQSVYSPALANAAFTLALISVGGCFLMYLNIPLGSLAILFALLARGNGPLTGRSRLAAIIGAATVLVSTCMTATTVYRIYTDPALRQQFDQALEYYSQFYLGDLSTVSPENSPEDSADDPQNNQNAPDEQGYQKTPAGSVLDLKGGEAA